MATDHDRSSEFAAQKKVDESWKNAVQQEKRTSPKEGAQPAPDKVFLSFISSLGVQALMALGETPGEAPTTGPKHTDLAQAQYLIDILQALSNKTSGNLAAEEAQMLQNLLYELRMKFVQENQASR